MDQERSAQLKREEDKRNAEKRRRQLQELELSREKERRENARLEEERRREFDELARNQDAEMEKRRKEIQKAKKDSLMSFYGCKYY